MITLYHLPGRRSERVRWLLEELGVKYQLVEKEHDELAGDADFLSASPLAKIPAMRDGSLSLFESGAMLEYIAEKYDSKRLLMPKVGTDEWAKCLQWIHAAETITLPLGTLVQHTIRRAEADRVPLIAKEARELIDRFFGVLEKELSQRDYIAGDQFSASDIMLGYGLARAAQMKLISPEQLPHLSAYVARLISRPAYQKAQ